MTAHALLSASAAAKWINCPASLGMEKDIPNTSSKFAEEGTAAHDLAARTLMNSVQFASSYVGQEAENGVTFTEEMAAEVQKYVDMVRSISDGKDLLIEKRVDYSESIDVPDSFGTSDTVIVDEHNGEIIIVDLKYGMGVRVESEYNEQMMLYAIGALNDYGVLGDFQTIRLIIHQPRLNHISEWVCDPETLDGFLANARTAAKYAVQARDSKRYDLLNPGEKQCKWCRAKATCPALSKYTEDKVGGSFEDLTIEPPEDDSDSQLSAKMAAIPLIEDWCKAVRAEVERRLFDGKQVQGYKLVKGRMGSRAWASKEDAEGLLKSLGLTDELIYDLSLISPTSAEKLLKKQPERWAKVEEIIVRREGQPSVAPDSDKRPAIDITPLEAGFEVLSYEDGE